MSPKDKKTELDIDFAKQWELAVPAVARSLEPFIQGGLWLVISKYDKKIQVLNKIISIAEIIPALDLGLPKGIVLASFYDNMDEVVEFLDYITESIEELPDTINTWLKSIREEIEEIRKETEEKVEEFIDEEIHKDREIIPDIDTPEEQSQFLTDYYRCKQKAEDSYTVIGKRSKMAYISTCMIAKGWGDEAVAQFLRDVF